MTPAAVLALGSGLGWGLSDFLGGRRSRSMPTRTVLLLSQLASLVLLVAGVAVLGATPPPAGSLAVAAAAGCGEVIGVAALYRGLAVGRAGIVSPASSAAPVLPVLVGVIGGDRLTAIRTAGLAVVVVGIVLTAVQPGPASAERVGAGLGYGLLSATGFGTSFVLVAEASRASVPWTLLVARSAAVVAIIAVVAVTRSGVRARPRDLPGLVLIGTLITAADLAYATASTLGDLSLVAVLAAFHPVVTIAVARLVLHERLGRVRGAGVAVSVGGIIALTAT